MPTRRPPAVAAPHWVRTTTAGAPRTTSAMLPPDQPAPPPPAPVLPPEPPLPTLRSPDGRLELTDDTLTVLGQRFALLELEAADVQPVRWLLWLFVGGFTLAGVLLAFLQNWLRTGPTALGLLVGAVALAWGLRGTNRLRLYRLGREAAHFALPGEPAPWQRLVAESNRRIRRRHDQAAAAAAALLAAEPPPAEPPPTTPADAPQ